MSKFYNPILVTALILLTMSNSAHSSKQKTEKEWNECVNQVSTLDQAEIGIAGIQAALSECGKKPVTKTKAGISLAVKDCNWLYKQPLQECVDRAASVGGSGICITDIDGFSTSSSSGMEGLPEKVFNENEFLKLCKQVCKSAKMPSRAEFGKEMCGENMQKKTKKQKVSECDNCGD